MEIGSLFFHISMRTYHLAAFVLCASLLPICDAAHAKPRSLKATSENFVSLRLLRKGGVIGIREDTLIRNHKVFRGPTHPLNGGNDGTGHRRETRRVVPLSPNQWKELMSRLRKADIPAVAGSYEDPGLMDGISETLTLTLRDGQNHNRQFIVSDYGDKAPAPLREFMGCLDTLLR